ncbi:uncharacterized protein TNCV_3100221 [Trichonephila clavipes]|nr:uncharacterized protein TNCV_3100221 [Trichonephila clavipes]
MEKPWKKLPFWRSKARFVFKILLALGFVMQSVKFLEMYLQYPSMVELDVSQPHEVEFPAFTLCNLNETATAGSDVVQSGRPIFDDFFQHLWPYIGNNTANVVFQMVKRLWLILIDQ